MSDDSSQISRRTVIHAATLIGASSVIAPLQIASGAESAQAFVNFTPSQGALLEAIVERLIPRDEHGPGAKEAHVANYIDRALGDALASSKTSYVSGLAALDKYAQASRSKSFLELSHIDQDSVLIDVETGGATGFTGSSAQFFAMLLNHTRQGMFGDPYYGGNANFVGWDLVGYPGVRTAVPAEDQKALEANRLKPARDSAYDFGGFVKDPHGH
ncbi:MAG TPA: gluconate 2-dehydrogenase subunit 3 family protein [Steroidobacteraceae bacterium]|nr:gluconate 2-dehydrogenase subunit 3 family protein [Steroidobacteraceae bacterium]